MRRVRGATVEESPDESRVRVTGLLPIQARALCRFSSYWTIQAQLRVLGLLLSNAKSGRSSLLVEMSRRRRLACMGGRHGGIQCGATSTQAIASRPSPDESSYLAVSLGRCRASTRASNRPPVVGPVGETLIFGRAVSAPVSGCRPTESSGYLCYCSCSGHSLPNTARHQSRPCHRILHSAT
jgi:hypothetical protein